VTIEGQRFGYLIPKLDDTVVFHLELRVWRLVSVHAYIVPCITSVGREMKCLLFF
jgi:hypothetical protein